MKKFHYLILGVLILAAACGKKKTAEEAIRPVFYQEAVSASSGDLRSFSGVTQPANEARLSFKVGGTIEKIAVKLGDTLPKGALLARIDAADYHINANKALSGLKNAEVQFSAAKSAFLRIENLYANNNVSLNEYEKAKAQFESAEAMLQTAKSQLKAAQNQLEYTTLTAPYRGTISAVMAQENEMAAPGHPIVMFSSLNNIEVKTAVPESIIARVSKGQKVTVRFTSLPGKTYRGEVSEVSPGSPNAPIFPVIVQIEGETTLLQPGMTGTVEIPLSRDGKTTPGAILVVPDAISHDRDGDFVYIANKTGEKDIYQATRKKVTPGEITPQGVEITEGLSDGDIVITAGLSFLYDGKKVRLLSNSDF
ncbi:MAG: efflux RND transporter periplasmic adaptor subunit [Lentimicrobiaceae bacterium]|nr:efflux RND transporter periplasmic adaptor subunit [Lentimicrobiaceae bacterium]